MSDTDDSAARRLRERRRQLEDERVALSAGDSAAPAYATNSAHLRREQIDREIIDIQRELGEAPAPDGRKGTAFGWLLLGLAVIAIVAIIGVWRPM